MPRSKQNRKRPQPPSENINAAVMSIIKDRVSIRSAAMKYGIAKSALARHVKKFRDSGAEIYQSTPHYDVRRVFSPEQETLLVNYLKQCAFLHYGLTTTSFRKLAFEFARKNNIAHPPKWNDDQLAGEGWVRWFKSRHSAEITLRKPEATSLSRSTSFNKENVSCFFANYTSILNRHSFTPAKIFNIDETGMSTVHNPPKILAPKGFKNIGSMTSGERGVNVTMIAAVNAIGNSVPPMFVFPRVHFKDYMLKGAPLGSVGAANPSGWSSEEIFLKFLDHFIQHTKPSNHDPIVLLMDNHESHISVAAVSRAKESGITMLTFHPHTSHKMQPLDRTVFGSFKTYYHNAMADWMASPENAGKPVTIYDVAELAGKAYTRAFTPSNIMNGFRVTGLVPLNQNIFEDYEFLPSYVTDRPEQNSADVQPLSSSSQTLTASPQSSTSLQEDTPTQHLTEPQPSTSTSSPGLWNNSSSVAVVSPEMIRPFPKAGPRKVSAGKRCRKGKSRVLTDTPEKMTIEEQKMKVPGDKHVQGKKKVKRSLRKELKDDNSSDINGDNLVMENMLDNDESDDLMDLLDDNEYVSAKYLEDSMKIEEMKYQDYVLVELKGKKICKHFIAKVLEIGPEEFTVQYLKKITEGDTPRFRIPEESELSYEVDIEDIKFKLPAPSVIGGSLRQQKQIVFPVSFTGYKLG